MEKREKIYEGKAKQIFALDDEAYLIMVYKDEATAFDGSKKGRLVYYMDYQKVFDPFIGD